MTGELKTKTVPASLQGSPSTRSPEPSSGAAAARAARSETPAAPKEDSKSVRDQNGAPAAREKSQTSSALLRGLTSNFAPQEDRDQPAEVETGTLDYYEKRAQDYERRHPGEEAPGYYREFGDKYAQRFTDLKEDLSPEGQEWVDRTLLGLQEKLETLRREDPEEFARLEEDPEALREYAFETHSDAYLEAGLADLPPGDLIKVAFTPDIQDSLNPEGLKEIREVAVAVLREHPELLATVPAQFLSQIPNELIDRFNDIPFVPNLPNLPEVNLPSLPGIPDINLPDINLPSLPVPRWPF